MNENVVHYHDGVKEVSLKVRHARGRKDLVLGLGYRHKTC